ncbi:MAG: hypothetical protein V4739_16240 [Pseudomonadota bacterium]
MREFDDVELWRVSAFQRLQRSPGESAYTRLDETAVLSTSLMADLNALRQDALQGDALEVMAACVRHSEPTLLYFQYEAVVWPLTLFPSERLYHSPRDLAQACASGLASLRFLRAEPPGVRAPGNSQRERVMPAHQYRPLVPLLRTLALQGPRKTPLSALKTKTSVRLNPGAVLKNLGLQGAMGSAAERLRRESVDLREIAAWPGMNAERASRLVNALYLSGELIGGSQPGRPEVKLGERLLSWARTRV